MVGKFVEFFGPGVSSLSIADRATISNMCPEYGATVGFFPVDDASLTYLRQTGEQRPKVIPEKKNSTQTNPRKKNRPKVIPEKKKTRSLK